MFDEILFLSILESMRKAYKKKYDDAANYRKIVHKLSQKVHIYFLSDFHENSLTELEICRVSKKSQDYFM